jgi:hypothetical protein
MCFRARRGFWEDCRPHGSNPATQAFVAVNFRVARHPGVIRRMWVSHKSLSVCRLIAADCYSAFSPYTKPRTYQEWERLGMLDGSRARRRPVRRLFFGGPFGNVIREEFE